MKVSRRDSTRSTVSASRGRSSASCTASQSAFARGVTIVEATASVASSQDERQRLERQVEVLRQPAQRDQRVERRVDRGVLRGAEPDRLRRALLGGDVPPGEPARAERRAREDRDPLAGRERCEVAQRGRARAGSAGSGRRTGRGRPSRSASDSSPSSARASASPAPQPRTRPDSIAAASGCRVSSSGVSASAPRSQARSIRPSRRDAAARCASSRTGERSLPRPCPTTAPTPGEHDDALRLPLLEPAAGGGLRASGAVRGVERADARVPALVEQLDGPGDRRRAAARTPS